MLMSEWMTFGSRADPPTTPDDDYDDSVRNTKPKLHKQHQHKKIKKMNGCVWGGHTHYV